MKVTFVAALLSFVFLAGNGEARAQNKLPFEKAVQLSAVVEPATAKRGETVVLKMTLDLAEGYYTYPTQKLKTDQSADQQYDELSFDPAADYVFVGPFADGPTKVKPGFDNRDSRYLPGPKVVWERTLVVRPDANPGPITVNVPVRLLVCDSQSCFPPKSLTFAAPLMITSEEAAAVDPKYDDEVRRQTARYIELVNGSLGAARTALAKRDLDQVAAALADLKRLAPSDAALPQLEKDVAQLRETLRAEAEAKKKQTAPAAPTGAAKPTGLDYESTTFYKDSLDNIKDSLVRADGAGVGGASSQRGDLIAFMLGGIFWGAISLITPCVFPMIPITVSFFLKQSEKEHHRPVTMALVYCGTIVVVLTIAAVLLLSFFRLLSVSPYMNFGLGLLFVFFALSLFGMYEIELPSGLARFTAAREGQGGLLGTMFMALTFTIISFACVAPFLGGFGGTAATAQFTWLERILGGLAFSVTFAAPFFVLAVFPSLLQKMPKSGSWLNSVKVVMGFLELAAAIKFFRAGELVLIPTPSFFTYDLTLGLYVGIAFLCGLYLLNFYRLPHDTPLENIGVVRMLIGLLFIALGLYLVPGLFKQNEHGEPQRPNGTIYAWIDSFLLPEPTEDKRWSGNLEQAIAEARAVRQETGQPQLVFVDFTGETCTNCKINEKSVFPLPEVRELMEKYKLVQLFTDKVPNKFYAPNVRARFRSGTTRQQNDAIANLNFQKAAFNTEQLPLYVILEPQLDGKVDIVGVYDEGKINDESAFAQFLKKPLDGANGQRADAGR